LCKLKKRSSNRPKLNFKNYIRTIPILIFIGVALLLTKNLLGKLPAIVFAIAFIGGFALWTFTTFRTRIEPKRIIIPYLLTIIFFIVHVYEEYLTEFEMAISDIAGLHVLEKNFLIFAAFVGPIVWLSGAILLLKKTDFGYYLLSFSFVAMSIAELSHFVFPFIENGTFHYVSAMYTAALPLILAGYGLYVLFNQIKKEKRLKSIGAENRRTIM